MKTKQLIFALFCALSLSFWSCSSDFPVAADENPLEEVAGKQALPEVEEGDEARGVNGCSVFGPAQQIPYWENDIQTVLTNCHTETLADMGNNCGYSGNFTQTVTLDYSFPAFISFDEATVNARIGVYAAAAQSNRPGSNWMIQSISWTRDFNCPSYILSPTYCYDLTITYRKVICQAPVLPFIR